MKQITLAIIGLLFLTYSCTPKNEKIDNQEIVEISDDKIPKQKKDLTNYKSQKLLAFYEDYGDEIIDITLVNTNNIFNGVIFKTKEKRAYIVELDTIIYNHSNPRIKTGQNFSFNQIENSVIKNIKFE